MYVSAYTENIQHNNDNKNKKNNILILQMSQSME